jgi:hypothetical protein
VNIDYNKLADRYIAIWNEPDPRIRRKLIDEVWAEDGAYHNRLFIAQGRDMIENIVSAAHADCYARGFVFRSQNNSYGHHDGVRIGWVLVAAGTGEVDTHCEDFLLLNSAGQIAVDYQFGLRTAQV